MSFIYHNKANILITVSARKPKKNKRKQKKKPRKKHKKKRSLNMRP